MFKDAQHVGNAQDQLLYLLHRHGSACVSRFLPSLLADESRAFCDVDAFDPRGCAGLQLVR